MNPFKKQKSKLKRKIALSTGIPTTRTGRKRKATKMTGQFWLFIIILGFYLLA